MSKIKSRFEKSKGTKAQIAIYYYLKSQGIKIPHKGTSTPPKVAVCSYVRSNYFIPDDIKNNTVDSILIYFYDVYVKPYLEKNNVTAKQLNKKQRDVKKEQKTKKISNKAQSVSFYYSDAWRALRYEAFKRYGRVCLVCGASPKNGIVLHVDHIKPRSLYPELELDINNLQILCEACNLGKSNRDSIDWRS